MSANRKRILKEKVPEDCRQARSFSRVHRFHKKRSISSTSYNRARCNKVTNKPLTPPQDLLCQEEKNWIGRPIPRTFC